MREGMWGREAPPAGSYQSIMWSISRSTDVWKQNPDHWNTKEEMSSILPEDVEECQGGEVLLWVQSVPQLLTWECWRVPGRWRPSVSPECFPQLLTWGCWRVPGRWRPSVSPECYPGRTTRTSQRSLRKSKISFKNKGFQFSLLIINVVLNRRWAQLTKTKIKVKKFILRCLIACWLRNSYNLV